MWRFHKMCFAFVALVLLMGCEEGGNDAPCVSETVVELPATIDTNGTYRFEVTDGVSVVMVVMMIGEGEVTLVDVPDIGLRTIGESETMPIVNNESVSPRSKQLNINALGWRGMHDDVQVNIFKDGDLFLKGSGSISSTRKHSFPKSRLECFIWTVELKEDSLDE